MKIIELFYLIKSKLKYHRDYDIVCCCKDTTDTKKTKCYNITGYSNGIIFLEEIKE